jgi:uncharacterized cupin superfamily protein
VAYNVVRTAQAPWGSYVPDALSEGWNIAEFGERMLLSEALGSEYVGLRLVHLRVGQASARYHYLPDQEELVFVLEGSCVCVADGDEFAIGAGTVVRFAPGTPHHELAPVQEAMLLYIRAPGADAANAVAPDPDR